MGCGGKKWAFRGLAAGKLGVAGYPFTRGFFLIKTGYPPGN